MQLGGGINEVKLNQLIHIEKGGNTSKFNELLGLTKIYMLKMIDLTKKSVHSLANCNKLHYDHICSDMLRLRYSAKVIFKIFSNLKL